MLRGIYAPTDFRSEDMAPDISVDEKLRIIAESPTVFESEAIGDQVLDYIFKVTLPFTQGIDIHLGRRGRQNAFTDRVDVGDRELYGHGIGTRLLRSAIRHAIEVNPDLETFSTGWARLGLLNTAVKVFGEENVTATLYGNRFGFGANRPLEELFDAFPPKPNAPYYVKTIEAQIDPALVLTWEQPTPK